MIVRCSRISLERFRLPETCLPSRSTMHRSSGFMKPFETRVGVQSTRSSLEPVADVAVVGGGESLGVDPPADLAHLLAKLPLVHHDPLPIMVPLSGFRVSMARYLTLDLSLTFRFDRSGTRSRRRRRLGFAERVGGLAALAQADQAAGPGAQIVVDDHFFTPSVTLGQASSGIGRAIRNRPPLSCGLNRDSVTRPITSAILIAVPHLSDDSSGRPDHAPAARRRRAQQLLRPGRRWSPAPCPPARPQPVERQDRLAIGPAGRRLELHHEQPLPLERRMLDRRGRRANHPAELHALILPRSSS